MDNMMIFATITNTTVMAVAFIIAVCVHFTEEEIVGC